MLPDLKDSYAWCWKICSTSQSSFFRSFYLLKEPRRRAMSALYAFSRISDDLSDGVDSNEPANAEALLRRWRIQTESLSKSDSSPLSLQLKAYDPLWPALRDSVHRFDIPIQLLLEIVDGVSVDQRQNRMRDWQELDAYCFQVASAVGLACVQIWKVREVPTQSAIDCGLAFQLTNIVRDVGEDARRGRIYIPQTLLQQFQVSESSWLSGKPDSGWKKVVETVAARALELYERGWPTIDALSPDSQRMFSLMWRSYRELLLETLRCSEQLWRDEKIRLRRKTKAKLASTHFVAPLYRLLGNPSHPRDVKDLPG